MLVHVVEFREFRWREDYIKKLNAEWTNISRTQKILFFKYSQLIRAVRRLLQSVAIPQVRSHLEWVHFSVWLVR